MNLIESIKFAYRVFAASRKNDNLRSHAENEMAIAWPEQCDMQDAVKRCVDEILIVFSSQQHSGSSAPYVIGVAERLMRFQTLSPLNGTDDEWMNVGDGIYQNKRCGRVFKDGADGQAYDIDGYVFREASGCCYTNRDSRRYVTFPYMPNTEYIDVPEPTSQSCQTG